jgi:two-component system, cell cycle sensor histidine kinase and response regulator CckA
MLVRMFPKNVAVSADAPVNLWTIKGDPTQFEQVMVNSCANARDAMPEGGALRIRVANVTLDETCARLNLEAHAGTYVLFEIADTGTGIPQDIIDNIFQPFFTTKEMGKGTGLGLSTVLTIVKSHGGFVNVESQIGRGACFKVYLPALSREGPG